MPTITKVVTQEVTPEELKAELAAYAKAWTPPPPFPYPAGSYLRFSENLAEHLKVDPDLPVMVVGEGGQGRAVIAFLNAEGQLGTLVLTEPQLRPEQDPPAEDQEAARGDK